MAICKQCGKEYNIMTADGLGASGMCNQCNTKTKKGVGGWLLLFCVGLTILSPLYTFYSLVTGYNETQPFYHQYPGLLTMTIIDIILSVGLMAFSIYAGISLWNIRPRAVKTAKTYLLSLLGYSILVIFLPFINGLPSEVNSQMVGLLIFSLVRTIIYIIVWYTYLSSSKRVKATYDVLTTDIPADSIISPDTPSSPIEPAEKLIASGRLHEAITAFEKIVSVNPENNTAWRGIASANLSLGHYEHALSALEQALQADPLDITAWFYKGLAHLNLNQYAEALQSYNRIIELAPDSDEAWDKKIYCHEQLGQILEAIQAREKRNQYEQ